MIVFRVYTNLSKACTVNINRWLITYYNAGREDLFSMHRIVFSG